MPGPRKGEGGRPRKQINLDVVRRAASIGCTIEEIAALIGFSRGGFYDRLEQDPELKRTIDEGRETGRATLRRLQWQKANAGDSTMMIWLGKNMLGQRDKTALTGEEGGPVAAEVVYRWLKPGEVPSG